MDPMLAAVIVTAALAALAGGGYVALVVVYSVNERVLLQACGQLLTVEPARFERLLAAIPQRVPLARLIAAAWQKRHEPAPVAQASFTGYRDTQPLPSYVERMNVTIAPDLAAAHRTVRRAFAVTLPGLLAPVVAWLCVGPPPPFGPPWLLALAAVALCGLSWRVARKLRRAFTSTIEVLLPIMDRARQA